MVFWNTRNTKASQASDSELRCQVTDISDTLTQINILKRFPNGTVYRSVGEIAWNKADPYDSSDIKLFRVSTARFQSQSLRSFLQPKHASVMLRWEFQSGHRKLVWEKDWGSTLWQVRILLHIYCMRATFTE